MKIVAITLLVLLLVNGPMALFLTIRHGKDIPTSVTLQKQLLRLWFLFAVGLFGLLFILADAASPLETIIVVTGVSALFMLIVGQYHPLPQMVLTSLPLRGL